jgi:DNA polymerase I-like protein with 3'-5' exonuclease and polymerase domains
MKLLGLDTETPKFDDKEKWKGTVYGDPRSIVCYSVATDEYWSKAEKWTEHSKAVVQDLLDFYDLIVMFNGKHDVGWLRKMGVDFSKVRIWDVQLGEFILGRQLNKFPSLDDTCIKYNIPVKLDVVKTEYWDKGIDTADIPWNILSEYAAGDAARTLSAYHAQLPLLTPRQRRLVGLMSMDMLVLQEMEWNGIKYNESLCKEKEQELDDEISKTRNALRSVYPDVPINFGSPDMLSAFLYGGTIVEDIKVADGIFKTGPRKGLPKLKNAEVEHHLPRLFTPVKGSELKKEKLYATNEACLLKIKAIDKRNKWILDQLLRLAKLETLNSKYYHGLPALNAAMHWPKERLHGNFNQTLAATGRLSSNKPNQQNFASELQDIFVSEFD